MISVIYGIDNFVIISNFIYPGLKKVQIFYLDTLMTDKVEVHVPRVSDYCVHHKTRWHVLVPSPITVLRSCWEKTGMMSFLDNQKSDSGLVIN
jgi:hypothetical protein